MAEIFLCVSKRRRETSRSGIFDRPVPKQRWKLRTWQRPMGNSFATDAESQAFQEEDMMDHHLNVVVDVQHGAVPILWHRGISFEDLTLPRMLLRGASDEFRDWRAKVNPFEKSTYETALISIPGQHSTKDYDYLNELASKFKRIVFFITGDEEALFCADLLSHPNCVKWWFAPPYVRRQSVDAVAPFGPTRMALTIDKSNLTLRDFDWSFMGQVTHLRRVQCEQAARQIPCGMWFATEGFFQGVPQPTYFDMLLRSKFVLCPSGPNTPDSFRFAEALEAGCIPIADGLCPKKNYPRGYWEYVFKEKEENLPFPIVYDWDELPKIFPGLLKGWRIIQERCADWWTAKKTQLSQELRKDIWITKT